MSELCWTIKDKKPITIYVKKHWTGRGYILSPDPMTMSYETWQDLYQCHRHQDIDVSGTSYDYENGECTFISDSLEDIKLWFDKYKGIIKENLKV